MMPHPDPRTVTASASRPATNQPAPSAPVVSEFASDPDMTELIAMFVEEMPDKVRLLQTHFQSRELADLQRVAHQLKGAGGGYGFSVVSTAAGRLEDSVKAVRASAPTPETHLAAIRAEVDSLISLCQRVKNAS